MTTPRTQRAGVIRLVLAAFLFVAVPRAALACPVCFGQNDSPLALGINYGIWAMLGLIAGLWVAFGSFFIYLRRRARMVEAADGATGGGLRQGDGGTSTLQGQAEAGLHPYIQGGTV